mmetsp:Transcript_22072/g.33125  ORF Transcript_22072/g.33125 Transcript_22072/m.33125 type:complete len:149 (-) Transcript_22072:142-588(-)
MSEVAEPTPIDTTTPTTDATTDDDDEASIMTEVAAPPAETESTPTKVAEEEPTLKEEEKADAFLAYIMNLWAMITGKVKEIDENAGISTKVAELDGEYHVSETLNNAKEVVSAKITELTAKGEEKEAEVKEAEVKEEKEWVEVDEKEQ